MSSGTHSGQFGPTETGGHQLEVVEPGSGPDTDRNRYGRQPVDVMVQCPRCKAIETMQFVGGVMTPCRKFVQRAGLVYHDCGSTEPCRLRGHRL